MEGQRKIVNNSVRYAGYPRKIPDMHQYQSANTLCVKPKNIKCNKSKGKPLETIKIITNIFR
jgi:hypothetical protein